MAKLTLNNVANLSGAESTAISTINANSDAIETALENTLSRDGTSPNTMSADIDMNDNDILNVDNIDVNHLSVAGMSYSPTNTFYSTSTALYSIGLLTQSANTFPYYTGPASAALTPLTAAGRALIDDADVAAQRTTLSVYSQAEIEALVSSQNGPRNPILYGNATAVIISYKPKLSMRGFRYKGQFKKATTKTFTAPAPTAIAYHTVGWGDGVSTAGNLAYESRSTAKTWYSVFACANNGDSAAVFKVVPFMRVASVTGSTITIAATGENELYNYPAWLPNTAYTVGQKVVNGPYVYEVTAIVGAGTSALATSFAGASGPTGVGGGIADSLVTWTSVGTTTLPPAWTATTAYIVGKVVTNGGNIYLCTVLGTSAGAGGPSGTGAVIPDNTVTWAYVGSVSNQPRFREKEMQIADSALVGCEVLIVHETIAGRKRAFSGRETTVTANNKAGVAVTVPGAYIGSAPLSIFPNQITLATIGAIAQGDWFIVAPNYQNYEYVGCFYCETSGALGAPSSVAELRNIADTGTVVATRGGGILCPQVFSDPGEPTNWTTSVPKQGIIHGDLKDHGIDIWFDTHVSPLALGVSFRHQDLVYNAVTGTEAVEYGMDDVHDTFRELYYKDNYNGVVDPSRPYLFHIPLQAFSFHPRLHFQSATTMGANTIRSITIQGWIEP